MGAIVGAAVGDTLGIALGVELDTVLGVKLGVARAELGVADFIARVTGACVGNGDGSLVGFNDGNNVGADVRRAVGDTDGSAVVGADEEIDVNPFASCPRARNTASILP